MSELCKADCLTRADQVILLFFQLHQVLDRHEGPGMEPGSVAWEAQSLSHWTTREVLIR